MERSFGILPMQKHKEGYSIFLVHHQKGHWAVPKGRKEGDEEDRKAAERELEEETGLQVVSYIREEPFVERYSFCREGAKIEKEVLYFLAEVTGSVRLQEEEIQDGGWFSFQEAIERVTFKQGEDLVRNAFTVLDK